jgi:hypothetical protein
MSHLLHEFMTGQKPKTVAAIDRHHFRIIFWPLLVFTALLSFVAWYPFDDHRADKTDLAGTTVILYVDADDTK